MWFVQHSPSYWREIHRTLPPGCVEWHVCSQEWTPGETQVTFVHLLNGENDFPRADGRPSRTSLCLLQRSHCINWLCQRPQDPWGHYICISLKVTIRMTEVWALRALPAVGRSPDFTFSELSASALLSAPESPRKNLIFSIPIHFSNLEKAKTPRFLLYSNTWLPLWIP